MEKALGTSVSYAFSCPLFNQLSAVLSLTGFPKIAMTIKISNEESRHLSDDSITFADGSGYIAEMAVYHELHCIKRIRRHNHLERYYPSMTPEERQKEEVHIGRPSCIPRLPSQVCPIRHFG